MRPRRPPLWPHSHRRDPPSWTATPTLPSPNCSTSQRMAARAAQRSRGGERRVPLHRRRHRRSNSRTIPPFSSNCSACSSKRRPLLPHYCCSQRRGASQLAGDAAQRMCSDVPTSRWLPEGAVMQPPCLRHRAPPGLRTRGRFGCAMMGPKISGGEALGIVRRSGARSQGHTAHGHHPLSSGRARHGRGRNEVRT